MRSLMHQQLLEALFSGMDHGMVIKHRVGSHSEPSHAVLRCLSSGLFLLGALSIYVAGAILGISLLGWKPVTLLSVVAWIQANTKYLQKSLSHLSLHFLIIHNISLALIFKANIRTSAC